ncbi:MAG: ATPase, T2SS/T4P/T4SS family [Planctomycetota bacterium]
MRYWVRGLLLLLVALALMAPRAPAQTLTELGAAAKARSELQGGNRGDRQPADDPEPAEDEPAEQPEATAPDPAASGVKLDMWDDQHSVGRSRSPQVSYLWPVFIVLGLFIWVRTGDWVNVSSQVYELGWGTWNPVAFLPYLLAFFSIFLLPGAAAGPVALLAAIIPLVVYTIKHNKSVESHQRVFTRDWFRYEWAKFVAGFGVKVELEKKAAYEKGAAVDLEARGADEETKDKANLIRARQSPGFVVAKDLIAQIVNRGGDQAVLDYGAESVAIKHSIDGVWHNGEAAAREDGDVMLAVLKQLANLDPTERKKKQQGEIGAKYKGTGYDVTLTSQGTKTGERVLVQLKDPKAKQFQNFPDLGMREKIRNQWNELTGAATGFLITSAQPGAGVTTLTDITLMETDRLMRDVFSIQDEQDPEREIENVVVHTYDSKKKQTPGSILEKLTRLYPNAYVCRDLVDKESAAGLLDEVKEGKLLITETGANDACEAVLRVIKKGAPHREVAENFTGSLNMRLIRLLCNDCKVGYEASPELLKKLRIPAGKVETLYRVPNEEEAKKPCPTCNGIGYLGRTGLFELLAPDDAFRQTLLKQPKMEALRKSARNCGMRTHQEEGILLVAKGATSLQELQRVLKT